jgi:hypothetical protein
MTGDATPTTPGAGPHAGERAASPAQELRRLMDGYLTTQLIAIAARLGVADVLAAGPRTGAEVAAEVGAAPGPLTRVLRGLALDGVLAEGSDGRFALTEVGACLRDAIPGSMRGPAIVRGGLYFRAAAGLLAAVTGGRTAFEQIYGEPFFDHLDGHPDHAGEFQASMAGRAGQEADAVVRAYDFSGLDLLVDVGGGPAVLLSAILRSAPGLRGVLFDREPTMAAAMARLEAEGVAERAECVAGDFFSALPAGADAYLLSRVLHDWDDADALRILTVCRAAMTPAGRLLVVEAILPERAVELPEAIRMDLHMLMLLGARERTEAELRRLLGAAGFVLASVAPTGSPAGLSVIEATPAGLT